ncbi:MAG: hypothetical protein HYY17_07240 [Planctomycetes bacterium]|nr:hypothetical protein [Planctomycetota bacterium]
MILALRIAGWGFFVIGMGLFIWAGGFSGAHDEVGLKRSMAFVGIFTALGGMVFTSVSRLLSHFAQVRRFKQQLRERTARQWQGELKSVGEKPPEPPKA